MMAWTCDQRVARAVRELQDDFNVNLGIGTSTLVANYTSEGMEVGLRSESVMLGMNPFLYEAEKNANLLDAGKQTITELPETSLFPAPTALT